MYIIKADGKLLYSPELVDDGYKVISPKMHLEVNNAGSLDFTIPPCNVLYDDVYKMKSIITVEQDGEEIFRGRISEESVDTYRQRKIYCEGDLSFLLDSLQAPFTFEGTQAELFAMLLSVHNTQMDAEKRFMVGITSGLDTENVITVGMTSYSDTLSTVQALLLDVYGGYIQTRTEGDAHYLDYLDAYTNECKQKIEFGVNLLDYECQVNARELCTVLVPLGATTDAGTALTIADVNDGKAYIENTAAIERYGRVYRTYTWDQVTDPAQLLELGNQYMQSAALPETLTIRAVDMYLLNPEADKIRKGDMVHLLSNPHGLDKRVICAAIDADLESGDQTEYTFGLPMQTMADQAVSTATQLDRVTNSINDQHRWLTETDTALNIAIENINLIGHRTSQVEADIDAAEAAITLKANQTSVDILETRLSGAEVRIDGAEAAIELKAGQATVDKMGERLTTAEVRIDGVESAIELKADLILLDGYLKVTDSAKIAQALSAQDVFCNSLTSNSTVWAEIVNTGDLITSLLSVDGTSATWQEIEVMTGGYVSTETATTPPFFNASGTQVSAGLTYVKSASFVPTTTTIKYLGA